MRATLKNFKQSPLKVRLVANLIRGKRIAQAREALMFLPKKSSPEVRKLLDSAVANARNLGVNTSDLIVKTISVNKGGVIRRFKPMARGRAAGIRKTMSIISIELGVPAAKVEASAKPARKTTSRKSNDSSTSD